MLLQMQENHVTVVQAVMQLTSFPHALITLRTLQPRIDIVLNYPRAKRRQLTTFFAFSCSAYAMSNTSDVRQLAI